MKLRGNMFTSTKFCILLICAIFLGNISVSALEDDQGFNLNLDMTKWKLDYKNHTDDSAIFEFVPKNETVENWTQLVTIQSFPYLNATMDFYYETFIKTLKEAVPESKVESKILSKTEDTLFFEWWIYDKSSNAQHEWLKLIRTPEKTFVIRYTTRKLDDVEKDRAFWEKELKDLTIVDQKVAEDVEKIKLSN